MDAKVKAEYEAMLTASILKHGSLVRTDPSIYGWQDYSDHGDDWNGPRHSLTCGIAKTGKVVEDSTWYEFVGTFTENEYVHGMEVHGVTCNCGKIKDRVFRWKAPMGEAIKTVVTEYLERSVGDGR